MERGARSGLITERCDNRNIRCFTQLPSDHIQYGHQGQRTFPAVERSSGVFFPLFLSTIFPDKTRASQQTEIIFYKFTVDFGRPKFK